MAKWNKRTLWSRVGRPVAPPEQNTGKRPNPRRLSTAALKYHGFTPALVVDVGVNQGTPQLYRAFPHAELLLVEPLHESEAYMRDLLTRRKGSYVLAAVGSQPGTATITVDRRRPGKSSLLERTALTNDAHDEKERRPVPVTTLDALLRERELRGPFGLKIDTEGFELEVIRGATEFLKQTQFVLAEVSIGARFEGSYTFAEFIGEMHERGFGACHVMTPGKAYSNVLFRPYGSA